MPKIAGTADKRRLLKARSIWEREYLTLGGKWAVTRGGVWVAAYYENQFWQHYADAKISGLRSENKSDPTWEKRVHERLQEVEKQWQIDFMRRACEAIKTKDFLFFSNIAESLEYMKRNSRGSVDPLRLYLMRLRVIMNGLEQDVREGGNMKNIHYSDLTLLSLTEHLSEEFPDLAQDIDERHVRRLCKELSITLSKGKPGRPKGSRNRRDQK